MDIVAELEAGIAATRAGKKTLARASFNRVLAEDPRNETAWLWMSKAMPTLEQSLKCLDRLLDLNPRHALARQARDVLHVHLMIEEASVLPTFMPPSSTAQRRIFLGEALVEAGLLTQAQLESTLQLQVQQELMRQPARLGELLVQRRYVRSEQIEAALAAQVETLEGIADDKGTHHLGEHLIRLGLVTRTQLHLGLTEQEWLRRQGESALLGEVLVRLGHLRRDQLNHALLEWRYPYEQCFWSETEDEANAEVV